MRMIPARNRTNYRGTVLINPGGPSESGTAFMGSLGSYLSDTVGDSFDVLGFDPRGVGESTPRLDCFTSQSERDGWLAQESHRLLSVADDDLLNLYVARAQVLGARCAAASASKEDIAEHMSTASVATDMVNIIEKLGQDKLHYWGFVSRLFSQHILAGFLCPETASSSELRNRSRPVLRGHVPRQGRAYDL